MRLNASLLVLGLLAGCSYGNVSSAPYSHGKELRNYRLGRIAADPSPEGMREAARRLGRSPDDALAMKAVLANLPEHLDSLEPEFAGLDDERQAAVLGYLGNNSEGPAVSSFVMRVLPSLSPETQRSAVQALAGDQDDVAINGLCDLALSADANLRALALAGLQPAESERAQTTLLKVYTNTEEPGELRQTALGAMDPWEKTVFREAMVTLAAAEDSGVAAATFDAFGVSTTPVELDAALAALEHPYPQARAVAFLGRAVPWRSDVRDALHAQASTENSSARWEAATALVSQDDPIGGPPLVVFLDDETHGADARERLDQWELLATEPLREKAGTLTTAEGKARAVDLLADVGAPSDRKLLIKLGASEAEQKRLDWTPYGLYPDAMARWGDLTTFKVTEASLSKAKASSLEAAAATTDKHLKAAHLTRAWAAGARSDAGRDAATKALTTATEAFHVPLNLSAKTTGEFAGATLKEATRDAVNRAVNAPIVEGKATHTALPEVTLSGELTCTDDYQNKDWNPMQETERFAYQVPNPAKEDCWAWLRTIPQKETLCNYTCHVANVGVYSTCNNCSCSNGPRVPANGWCNTSTVQVTTSEWEAANDRCQAIPETLTEYAARYITKTQRVRDTVTTCKGQLQVSFGPRTNEVAVDFQETKKEQWWTYEAPGMTLPDGQSIPSLYEDNKFYESTDKRQERLEGVLQSKLSGWSVTEQEVRKLYAAALDQTVADKDAANSLKALFFARPGLADLDGTELHRTLLSAEPEAFPMGWMGSKTTPEASVEP